MGYTTEFSGHITIDPPLSDKERDYLTRFSDSRRMDRARGPYFIEGSGYAGQGRDPDIRDNNIPPPCQPGLWCQWVPSDDGSRLEWNGAEKFYAAPEWMSYLRSHFIATGAAKILDPQHQGFWTPHRMSGEIMAVGEDAGGDTWKLIVNDEGVFTQEGSWTPEARTRVFGDEDAKDDNYVGSDEALAFIVANPTAMTFGPLEKIDNFNQPDMEARILAQKDLQALEKTVPSRPVRTPGSGPRV